MPNTTHDLLPRQVADAYVDALVELDPITGTFLGEARSARRLPDYSPAGARARADLARATLDRLAAAELMPGAERDIERRCGRLLRSG
ncbi:hypothetical protein ACFQ2B_29260 [Streptomyces stramineus]